jgi:rod shape-determining protein MreD
MAAAAPLNPLVWLGLPVVVCVAATTILTIPLRVFGLQLPEPVFALVPAFAWAVIRPSILPPLVLLGLGFFLDLIWGAPKGLWPACLLAAYAPVLVFRNILAGQSYPVMWAWYAAACAFAFLTGIYIMSLDSGVMPSLVSVLGQFAVTAALFPFAHMLIERYEDADVRFR